MGPGAGALGGGSGAGGPPPCPSTRELRGHGKERWRTGTVPGPRDNPHIADWQWDHHRPITLSPRQVSGNCRPGGWVSLPIQAPWAFPRRTRSSPTWGCTEKPSGVEEGGSAAAGRPAQGLAPARLAARALLRRHLLRKPVPRPAGFSSIALRYLLARLASLSPVGPEDTELYSLLCSQHLAHSRCLANTTNEWTHGW